MPGNKGIYDHAREPDEGRPPATPSADDADVDKETPDVTDPDEDAEPTA